MTNQTKGLFRELWTLLSGSALFALAMNLFLTPKNIVMGGVSGLAVILHHLIPILPIGAAIVFINIPLFLMNLRTSGKSFLLRTAAGVLLTSFFTDLTQFLPAASDDSLLCAILGGVLMGAGTGLLLSRGFTTGGTDLVAWWLLPRLQKKKRGASRLSMGNLIFLADAAVVLLSALVFRSFEGIFHSVISIYASSRVMDAILAGAKSAKAILIFSGAVSAISGQIHESMKRGTTLLRAVGGYTGKEKNALLCVVSREELYWIRKLIFAEDPAAFVLILDAAEVLGDGFTPPEGNLSDKP